MTDTPETREITPDDFPPVRLPGDDRWFAGYEWGNLLCERWPDESSGDFAEALSHNVFEGDDLWGRMTSGVTALKCDQEGENDGEPWVWTVTFADGTTWQITGWCDYTGWDCQSGIEAVQVQP